MTVKDEAVLEKVNVPAEFKQRKRLWIYGSLWLNHADCPYASLSVQTLGYAERLLLEMEARLALLAGDQKAKRERDLLLSECSAHSILWVFGLYETLRTLREAGVPRFAPLAALFEDIEALRMPLAKHEVMRWKGAPPSHYPTGMWDPDRGHVGWQFFDPRRNTMRILCRTELANEFLSVAGAEPEYLPPFPIGGQLGEFED